MKKLFFVFVGIILLAGAGCEAGSLPQGTLPSDKATGTVVVPAPNVQATSTNGKPSDIEDAVTSSKPLPGEVPGSEVPVLGKALCESGRGHWNECASACRNQPEGSPCIMMCVQQCECGGIAGWGCPSGYECADYVPGPQVPDAMGICKPSADK